MHHLRPGERLEQVGGQVEPVADAGRAERNLAVRAPRQRDQLLNSAHRQAGIDTEDIGFGNGEIAYRLEVAHHVERQLLVKAWIDDERARGDEQRVAVGRCFRHGLRANDAVRARSVLHHERLPGLGRNVLTDNASDHIGRAARREGHNHAHRLAGILWPGRGGCTEHDQGSSQGRDLAPPHPQAHGPLAHGGTTYPALTRGNSLSAFSRSTARRSSLLKPHAAMPWFTSAPSRNGKSVPYMTCDIGTILSNAAIWPGVLPCASS